MLNNKPIERQPSSTQNIDLNEYDNSIEDDPNNEQILLNHKHTSSKQNKNQISNTNPLNYSNSQLNQIQNYEKIIIQRKSLKNKMNQNHSNPIKQKILNFLKALFLILIIGFILSLNSPYTLKQLLMTNNNIEQKDLKEKTLNLMIQQKKQTLLQNDNLIQTRLPLQIKEQNLDLISYNKLKTQNKLLKKLLKIQLQNQLMQNQQRKQQKQQLIKLNKQININQIDGTKVFQQKQDHKKSKDLPTQNKLETPQSSIKKVENENQNLNPTKEQNLQIKTAIDSYIKLSSLLQINQKLEQSKRPQFQRDGEKCKQQIDKKAGSLGELYQMNVDFLTFKANSRIDAYLESSLTNIKKEKYQEAIQLVDLIHRVDQKGNITIEENFCQDTLKIRNRLTNAMKSQFQRLNQEYQIDYYHSKQLRFCIVVNSYNNAHNGLIYRNLDSILQQNYTNYHVVYTNDKSPDRTGELVKQYLEGKATNPKFKIKLNTEKVGMMQNIYQAITYDCQMGQIVVLLDGDDSFIGTNVLSFLNAAYQKQKIALMWNNFMCIFTNSRASIGFSSDYSEQSKNKFAFRSQAGFPSSHLKSFYVDLFRKIKVDDLKYNEENKFYGGASDLATMYPMIQMTNDKQNPKFKYIPEILYEYRFDTGQLGMVTNRQAQFRALAKIQSTTPYKSLGLSQYTFIDQAIKRAVIIKSYQKPNPIQFQQEK